jgi:L-asparaginase II
MPASVEVVRGHVVESLHRLSVAVARPDGTLVAHSGEPDLVTFWRSAAKFFQAIPLVAEGAADAFGVDDEELALACASHNGEPRHVEVARRLLARSGSLEADLVCGPHPSLAESVARAMTGRGEKPTRLHNNCSGKHAAMLALARHRGWDRAAYAQPDGAVQSRCFEEVRCWTGLAPELEISHATDGCGVPSFALSLRHMATAYARLAAAPSLLAPGAPLEGVSAGSVRAAARLLAAVRRHPFLIAGTERLDTQVIEATGGRVIAKVGAEGVYCAALPELKLGVALKVEDGALRALAPALLGVLDALLPSPVPNLDAHRRPVLTNTRGVEVGHVIARVELTRGARIG